MAYPSKTDADTILASALALLEQEGLAALSMRALARRLGLRASSLYRYFASLDAIEAALAERGAADLRVAIGAASDGLGPSKALFETGHAYLAFARARPQLYALLAVPRPASGADEAKRLWNTLLGRVGAVSGLNDDTAGTVAVWSFLHGFADLERTGLFGASGPRGGFDVGLRALVAGLEASRADAP